MSDTRATSTPPSHCGCTTPTTNDRQVAKWAAAAGLLASVGLCAACCLLPVLLMAAGVGGAWIATLDTFTRFKWPLLVATTALLAYGFYLVYGRRRSKCSAGTACKTCGPSRSVRVGLWLATILAVSGVIFEHFEQ